MESRNAVLDDTRHQRRPRPGAVAPARCAQRRYRPPRLTCHEPVARRSPAPPHELAALEATTESGRGTAWGRIDCGRAPPRQSRRRTQHQVQEGRYLLNIRNVGRGPASTHVVTRVKIRPRRLRNDIEVAVGMFHELRNELRPGEADAVRAVDIQVILAPSITLGEARSRLEMRNEQVQVRLYHASAEPILAFRLIQYYGGKVELRRGLMRGEGSTAVAPPDQLTLPSDEFEEIFFTLAWPSVRVEPPEDAQQETPYCDYRAPCEPS